ncbi:MAG: hypothetical protein IKI76_05145 [Selenomonadaceae bacterium]|nr:hypothetical protein [Selenomonadaceae bacterium]
MKTLSRITKIICFLVLMSLPCMVSSQGESNDWWEDDTLTATGYSLAPKNISNAAQARTWSRREALEKARNQMTELIKDINVAAGMTVRAGLASGAIDAERLDNLVRDAKILSERYGTDNSCTIVLTVPVYGGGDSVAGLTFKPVEKEDFLKPTVKSKAKGNYTGLIIDCGDLELEPVLAPVIRQADNQSVYSYNNLDYDKVIANGMIDYAREDKPNDKKPLLNVGKIFFNSACAAKNKKSRAGDNPLVIKAKVISDGNSTPVISVSDANKILTENEASHFLDEGSVVFTGYRVGGVRA